MTGLRSRQALLFDWGGTLMKCPPDAVGPMCAWPVIEVFPGVEAALRRLHPGMIVALATNAADSDEADIRKALARGGLDDLVDTVFCFRKLACRKPSPAFYEAVLDGLGLDASRVFMVGDSFDGDVLAANALQIRAVWFNPRADSRPQGELFRTIYHFRELPDALRDFGAELPA